MRVAVCGGGVVGGGVVELLQRAQTVTRAGCSLELKLLLVRDASKKRNFAIPDGCQLTADVAKACASIKAGDVDLVVEAVGGADGTAWDLVQAALGAGIHVVTANKALVAEHAGEVEALMKASPQARLGIEACVCGGIPCVQMLAQSFVADRVTAIRGIFNGTTNFILSNMDGDPQLAFATALAEAQRLGFAEADPTGDVQGHDARHKAALLARDVGLLGLCCSEVACRGIPEVSPVDFALAKTRGRTVRLLGCAVVDADDDSKVHVRVTPSAVPLSHATGAATGCTNVVVVSSENLGETTLVGPGAGRFPTANSCVNDVVAVARGSAGRFGLDAAGALPTRSLAAAGLFKPDGGWLVRLGGGCADDVKAAAAAAGAAVEDVAEVEGGVGVFIARCSADLAEAVRAAVGSEAALLPIQF